MNNSNIIKQHLNLCFGNLAGRYNLCIEILQFYLDNGVNINSSCDDDEGMGFIENMFNYNEDKLDCLLFLLEKGIDYKEFYENYCEYEKDYNEYGANFINFIIKYHKSKLLKEKLEIELKSTDLKTKRSKI